MKHDPIETGVEASGPETDAWAGLGAAWRGGDDVAQEPLRTREIAGRARKFVWTIRWRNTRELAACVVLAAWAGYKVMTSPSPLEALPGVAMILAAIWVGAQFVLRGGNLSPPSPSATTTEHLAYERAQIERQRRLLLGVRWWYLAPLAPPMVLTSVVRMVLVRRRGGDPWSAASAGSEAISIAAFVVVFVFVDRLNRRAAKKLGEKLRELGEG